LVTKNMVPEFGITSVYWNNLLCVLIDNLYLDMNGIIHNCAKEYDPEKEGGQRTEEEIFIAIFSYIQTLFEIIRPQKLFFLAVDGTRVGH
jgi:5'-3' exonuclease